MNRKILLIALLCSLGACTNEKVSRNLAHDISNDTNLKQVVQKSIDIVKTGFNAGDGYNEVWIRDYNTFIRLACDVHPLEMVRENLLVFFRLQGENGNIIDGFVPKEQANINYDYIASDLEPGYLGHKNSVETDQESSLIQAIYKYVKKTGDNDFLQKPVAGKTVVQGMERALEFLMNERYNEKYGLIYGATTVDWGDVQPEHDWGVDIDENTHFAIDVYDNAMFLIALDNFIELVPEKADKWKSIRKNIAQNVRKHLWDKERHKFIPHIYLNGSPFPENFDEDVIFYHGGTAVAIEAGLLSRPEIEMSLNSMLENVKNAGAASIGLTIYPPYPQGFFKNKAMVPYGYQNGGDWTWFGGRMIQQLVRYGFVNEAYQHIQPMIKRVVDNDGFYEVYSKDNEPKGSGTFRGSAGVLYDAIQLLYEWAENN